MERRAPNNLVAFLALALLGMLALGPSHASAAEWKERRLYFAPRFPGELAQGLGPLLAVSCPSRSFCVAAGQIGMIGASTNPTGGTGDWKSFYGPKGSDPHGPPPPPGFPMPAGSVTIKGVSCPSVSFCVAVSGNGDVYTSFEPDGGEAAWVRADVDGDEFDTHLEGVSCPTVSFCVAVSGGVKDHNHPRTSGKILSSTNPAGGSSAWQVTQLDPSFDLRGVSCATPSLCVAVGQDGLLLVSTDPTGGPSAWRDTGAPGGPGHLQGVACALGGALCVAGNSGGNLITNTDPGGSPARWSERNGGGSVAITGISCPSASQCIAVDNNGDVLTSTDPTGGYGSWSLTNVIPYVPPTPDRPPLNAMFGISCPSPAFCAIAAADATVLTSTGPFSASPEDETKTRRVRRPKRPRTILAHVDRKRSETEKARIRVRFRFYAVGRARGFVCKRDRRRYRHCKSPVRYWADRGRHVFRVRAIGVTGLRGPVALDRFRIRPIFGVRH